MTGDQYSRDMVGDGHTPPNADWQRAMAEFETALGRIDRIAALRVKEILP